MGKFKPGDKLLCIDDHNGVWMIKKGQIYTFKDYRTDIQGIQELYIEEIEYSWKRSRFVLAQEYMNEQEMRKLLGVTND